ncbi:MAG: HAMP domain-containing histidine kinase [Alphaproteobacteria bacterium]|nr:HAMP domain-containing histidine kinase [Alphaproteobacteria bacterium]
MQDSVTAGSPPASRAEPQRRGARAYRSLVVKTVLLAVIFLVVPLILYVQFKAADEEKQDLLLRSVREQGRVLGQALVPLLAAGGDHPALPQLGRELARFADEVTNVKLLFAPPGGGFFYIASWPVVPAAQLDIEREKLDQEGVLQRLAQTCQGQLPDAFRYSTPNGGDEVVTSVTPLSTPAGCWVLVTSFPAGMMPGARIGVPYWATPEVKFAAAIYLAMVLITLTTFLRVRRGLRHFTERARAIRDEGPGAGPFGAHNEIPELDDVAEEFDRMVDVLHSSANDIRRAAEDNAHAFKTPIAVIRQSLEPLKRGVAAANQRGLRALGLIESSLDKLDGLVASARRLGEATADLIDTRRTDVDLSSLVHRLLHAHVDTFSQRRLLLKGYIGPGILAFANEEMVETVVENVVDNAISFSPEGGEIGVRLEVRGDRAVLLIGDSGPGVPEADLGRIFDRYFSQRPGLAESDDSPVTHFGIGLWIARRNVEALGGTIRAENRSPSGLLIRIELPLTETSRAAAAAPKSAMRHS